MQATAIATDEPALLHHVIEYTATTPIGEQRGLTTITTTGPRIPYNAWATTVPGLRHAEILLTRGDALERPILLGPTPTDLPRHPGWCTDHDNELDDGRSVCFGDTLALPTGLVDEDGESVGAGVSQTTGKAAVVRVVVNGTGLAVISPAVARAYGQLLIRLAEQAERGAA